MPALNTSQEEARELPTEAMIEAGIDACQRLRDAMAERDASAHPHDLPDYDEGDVMREVYRAMQAARPTPDLGDVDELVSKVAANLSLVITSAYLMCKDGRGNEAAHMLAERAIIALRAALDKNG